MVRHRTRSGDAARLCRTTANSRGSCKSSSRPIRGSRAPATTPSTFTSSRSGSSGRANSTGSARRGATDFFPTLGSSAPRNFSTARFHGGAFLAACLAAGDVPVRLASPRHGQLLEVGFDEFRGAASNAWRQIVASGELPPTLSPRQAPGGYVGAGAGIMPTFFG